MLNAPENVACVGGPNLIFDSDPIFAKAVGYAQETFLGSGGSAQSSNSLKKKYVQSLPNCNAMYKKYVIEDAGFFDEYFKIGQDGELNYRISKNNYLFLYVPEAVVWHHRRGSFKTFSVRMFKYGKWMGKLFEKHRKLIRWYAILPSIAMVYALFSLIVYVKYPVFIYILQFLIFIYILLLLYATYTVILNMKSVKGIAAIVILPTQHIMYGLGFLSNLFKLGLR
jgi:GT2 family glycosyltransferase